MKPNNPIMLNAVSNSGTKLSNAIDASFIFQGSLQAVFSDSGAGGTLLLQASNDPYEQLPGAEPPQNWVDIPDASATVSGGASVIIGYVPQVVGCYKWLRANWVQSAGAGTITVNGFFQEM